MFFFILLIALSSQQSLINPLELRQNLMQKERLLVCFIYPNQKAVVIYCDLLRVPSLKKALKEKAIFKVFVNGHFVLKTSKP